MIDLLLNLLLIASTGLMAWGWCRAIKAEQRVQDLEQVILGEGEQLPEYEVVEYLRTQVVKADRSWLSNNKWQLTSRSGIQVTRADIKQAVREMMAMETVTKQLKETSG